MIKAIIFDFDGVIGDTYGINFELCKTFHKNLSEQDFKDHHNGNVFAKPVIKFKPRDRHFLFTRRKELFTKDHLFPLKHLLTKLSKSVLLFIVSSTNEKNLEHFLKLDDYHILFEKILGEETHKSKVVKFKMIFDQYNLKPEECLFVTDTIGDIIEAREVNLKTIAVLWGYHGKELLEQEKPLAITRDEQELLEIIEKLLKSSS